MDRRPADFDVPHVLQRLDSGTKLRGLVSGRGDFLVHADALSLKAQERRDIFTVLSANVSRLSSQNGHGAQDATILLFFLRLQQHASNHLHTYHAQRSRETTEASVKQGELYGDASQPVSVMTVGGRTVRRCSGGTVASQEPCRPVPVRCESHRSAGVAPPVRWCPCPIGIRWYSFDNVAA